MRRPILLVLTVAVLAVLAAPASATTTPGVIYPIKVTITGTTFAIQKDRFTKGKITRYPRGALIRYEITNKSSRPFQLEIWGNRTVTLRPHGGHDTMLVNWGYRGRYVVQLLLHKRAVGPKHWIVIF
jgi:hypothetical protein